MKTVFFVPAFYVFSQWVQERVHRSSKESVAATKVG